MKAFVCRVLFYYSISCVVVLSWLSASVRAFSSGAGGCEGEQAAVSGQHLDTTDGTRDIQMGSLEAYGISFVINNNRVQPTEQRELAIDTDYALTVTSQTANMKGILIRVEIEKAPSDEFGFGDDVLSFELQSSDTNLLQDADICESSTTQGLTHIDATPKQEVTGTIFFIDEAPTLWVDVTVVFNNTLDGPSQYAYDRFEFSIVASITATALPTTITTTNEPTPAFVVDNVTFQPTRLSTVSNYTSTTASPTYSEKCNTSTTASPAYSEKCYICDGDETKIIDSTLEETLLFDGVVYSCDELDRDARAGYYAPDDCGALQARNAEAIEADDETGCTCIDTTPTTPTAMPTTPFEPTLSPTAPGSTTSKSRKSSCEYFGWIASFMAVLFIT